jgi:hypothetical protein
MSTKTELQKLRVLIEEHTKPPSDLSGFFELSWPSTEERPLWSLACFDLARLVALLELPERTQEQDKEITLRLAVAAEGGELREMPPFEMILKAVKEEQSQRTLRLGRHSFVDGRPHPQGGPGLGPCGLYHQELDPSINWDLVSSSAEVVVVERCPVCGGEPFTYEYLAIN